MPNQSNPAKRNRRRRDKPALGSVGKGGQVVWLRLDLEDFTELRRRQIVTGGTPAAQIKIIVHNALNPRKKVLK